MVKIRKIKRSDGPVQVKATTAERKAVLISFLEMLSRGYTKDEIVQALGLETSQFESLLSKVYSETEDDHLAKTPLRIFAEYIIKKNAISRDLEALKDELRGKNKENGKWYNGQAFVMACRLQSEIIDQQIRTGQDLGVIEKRPDGFVLIDGRDPREMNEVELEDSIVRELTEAGHILKGRGTSGAKILAFKTMAGKITKP